MAERKPRASELADRIADLDPLDPVAEPVASKVRDLLPGGPVKDALSGTWLGHAVHPLLQLAPLGTWMSAVLLDLVGGEDAEGASDLLIGTGLLAAAPTFVSGWSDYADTTVASERVRRLGIVHAAANGAGALLFA